MVNSFTEMCSGSEEGSYLRLIDLYHSARARRVDETLNPKPQNAGERAAAPGKVMRGTPS